jgi:Flp pilus assembly protein TadD
MMRRVARILLLCVVVLAGCAQVPPAPLPPGLLHDSLFAPRAQPVRVEDVFAISPAMQRYLRDEIAGDLRRNGAQRGLLEALYRPGRLRLEYEGAITRNAAQAFDARAGNCLSLVIMTAAFARELGLPVGFQSAYVDETWTRRGALIFRSGHVNITLGQRLADRTIGSRLLSEMTVDFLPAGEIRGMRTRPIDEATVVAMYFNKRAAESLAQGLVDEAYWWARAAVQQRGDFDSAINTLGVVYQRHGEAALAERAFRTVLDRDADNAQALSNLAQLLEQQGRTAEARVLAQRLAAVEPHPPFHFFDLGRAAFDQGDFALAREMFSREVARAPHQAQFHHWLAQAEYLLGDLGGARRHLTQARDLSASGREQALYGAKLDWLNARRAR